VTTKSELVTGKVGQGPESGKHFAFITKINFMSNQRWESLNRIVRDIANGQRFACLKKGPLPPGGGRIAELVRLVIKIL
jgi:hypothetical protein